MIRTSALACIRVCPCKGNDADTKTAEYNCGCAEGLHVKERLWTPLLVVGMTAVLLDETVLSGFWALYPRWAHAFADARWWHTLLAVTYASGLLAGMLAAPVLLRMFGLKRVAVGATAICAVGNIPFWFPGGAAAVCSTRALLGIGSGLIWVGMFGWIAASAPASRRGEAFGWIYSASTVGGIAGGLLGGLAGHVGMFVFPLMAVPLAATVVVAARTPAPAQERVPDPGWVRRFARSRHAQHGAMLTGLNVALYVLVNAVSSLKLAHAGYGPLMIGVGLASQDVLSSVASPFLGRLSDRVGASRMLEFTLAAVAVFLVAMAFQSGPVLLLLLVGSGSVFKAPAVIGGIRLMQAAAACGLDQAYSIVALNTVWALTWFLSAGVLTSLPGLTAPFLVGAGLVGAVIVAVLVRPRFADD